MTRATKGRDAALGLHAEVLADVRAAADAEAEPPRAPRAFHLEEALAAAVMGVLCLITLGNVLTRYFTSISFAFTEEISIFLVVVMTFVGAATAFSRGNHLAIMALVDRLPTCVRQWQVRFALLCGLVMFGLLGWYGAWMWWDDVGSGLTSPGLGVPQWWYTLSVPVLSLLIEVRLLQRLVSHWNRL